MSIFSNPQLLNSPRWKNMRVGILGGSFNPPHAGHVHISKMVLKSLHLDAIWWLVTPQNPLKSAKELLPIDKRIELSREIIDNYPKILVTGMEQEFDTTYSYASIKALKKHYPNTDFAWITGMDNAHSLHLWQNWQELLNEICMVHVTRMPPVKLIKQCPVRMMANQKHITLNKAGCLPLDSNTTYWLLQKKMIDISSTELRLEKQFKTMF